ncbi:MAG: glycosyl hydrolase family 18 protein [Microgenomates group bacterium]
MKYILFLVIFCVGFWGAISLFKPKAEVLKEKIVSPPIAGNPIQLSEPRTSVFVPYWSLSESDSSFSSPPGINRPIDTAIYFSVSATTSGINKTNTGYTNIGDFASRSADTPNTLLTISMVDDDINNVVLESSAAQEKIISQAVVIAKEHGFDGIILDLEVGGLAGKEVNTQILVFVKKAAEIVKESNLSFAMTLYGDSFYRSRPYSIELLSPHVDQFYIMAYDMHKLWGTPGPNFPAKGADIFGYDMQTMIRDMLKFTTRDKLTVIFGLYGHDWTVDEQKRPFTAAKTLTQSQIQKKFIDSCEMKNCIIKRNPYALETEINYIDEKAHYHIVWFEDARSVSEKIGLLKENGINSVSYWAYSYY